MRSGPEEVLEVAPVQAGRGGVRAHEGHAVALAGGADGRGDRGMEAADDGHGLAVLALELGRHGHAVGGRDAGGPRRPARRCGR